MYREWLLGAGAVMWTRGAARERTSRILPDGCIDLIWSQGRDGTTGITVAGPDTAVREVLTPAGLAYVGVRLPPGLGPALLGVPAHELRDAQPDLGDVWPGRGRRLAERITAATDRPAALGDAVRAEVRRHGGRADPVAREVVHRLRHGDSVEGVARAVGLSPRQLHRRSLAAFGYGPKTLARVLRLHRAMSLARDGRALADVAALAGYADQAHFTREVRLLTGATPLSLLRDRPPGQSAANSSAGLPSGSRTAA